MLVFKLIYWGAAGSGISTIFQWFSKNQPSKEGRFSLVMDGATPNPRLEYTPGKKLSNLLYYAYKVSTKAGENPHLSQYLRGVDGLVFVWDSSPAAFATNVSSLNQLFEAFGQRILVAEGNPAADSLPLVILANKRDLTNPTPVTRIQEVLEAGKFGKHVIYETIAATGENVQRSFVFAMREPILHHYKRLQAGGNTRESRATLERYQEIHQDIADKCAAHDFEAARAQLGIAMDWDKEEPLSVLDPQEVLPALATWESLIVREEKSYKVWNVTRELAKKYPRVHILELVKHVGLPQPEVLQLLLELITQKKVPARYDPESEGIDLQLYMEELDELRKVFDDWSAPGHGKKT